MKDLSQLIELPIKVDVSGLTHEEREQQKEYDLQLLAKLQAKYAGGNN